MPEVSVGRGVVRVGARLSTHARAAGARACACGAGCSKEGVRRRGAAHVERERRVSPWRRLPAATAAPREAKQAASQQLQPGMDLSKLASAALERREEQPEPEDEPEGATTRPILRALPTHWLTHHAHAQTKGASSTSTGRRTTRREAWRRCGRRQRRLWMRRRTTRTRTRTM